LPQSKVDILKQRYSIFDSDDILYIGNKKYIAISSSSKELSSREQMQKVELKKYPFVMVIGIYRGIVDEALMSVANLHKLTAFVV
jgi:hypothetical protein